LIIIWTICNWRRGLGNRNNDSREREIAEISPAFKSLAKDLGIPVIAVSQLNRGLERRDNKRPHYPTCANPAPSSRTPT